MPEFTNTVPNGFCWVELNTSDPAAAKKFYAEIFGWDMQDMTMPTGTYTMTNIGGKMVSGIGMLPENAKKMGAPPHWLSYVAVEDLDAAIKKAGELGGKVLVPAMDVGPGKMSVLQDPTGGVLGIWQQKQSMGTWLYGETGALCWNELMTENVDQAGKFYLNLFGWKSEVMSMPKGQYTVFKNGAQPAGGMMAIGADMKGAPTAWCAYFSVKNTDDTVKKAESRGGKVLVPGTDIPNVGRFAVLTDPQGAAFAVLQPAS